MLCVGDTQLTLAEVYDAQRIIAEHLQPTPLNSYPLLSNELGFDAWVKLENTQPIGAFKVRGGLYLFSQMSQDELQRGVVSATRGNHGQSLAYAAKLYGASSTIFVPHGNNPDKNKAMRALGAEVIVEGEDFDAAVSAARTHAFQSGARLVHPADPNLVTGVATMALEMLDQHERAFDALVVPVGVGSCITGLGLVMKQLSPMTKIIGVQAENASAMYQSWVKDSLCSTDSANTLADGLAVRCGVGTTLKAMVECVDEMLLVNEAEIREAVRLYAETTHQLAEGAAAAGLAGAMKLKGKLQGKRVGLVLTGGNIDRATLKEVLFG